MKTRSVRTRALAAMVALALLVAMQVVPAGAAEPQAAPAAASVAAASRGASASAGEPSAERLKLTEQFRELDLPRPERAEVSALADDDIPGVPIESVSELPWPVVLEDLDSVADEWDVYSLTAYPGDQIAVYADPDPLDEGSTLDLQVYLWDASATSVASAPLQSATDLAHAPGWICYTVPESAASTTYYVGIHAASGGNIADYQWGITSRSDGNIPGVTLPDSGFEDDVENDGDMDDVFAIHLGEGETFEFTFTVTDGVDLRVGLFGPGATDAWATSAINWSSPGLTGTYTHTVGAGQAGIYYLDVFAYALDPYPTSYTLEWEVDGHNIPGAPFPASGTVVDLHSVPQTNVGYIDLRAGETLSVSVTDPTDQLQLWLLGPEAIDVGTDSPLTGDASSPTTKSFTYTVPPGKAGRYYVDVDAASAVSSTITWSTRTNPARLAGAGRYETAVLACQRDFSGGADTVVIASGEGFADALSAAGLAGAYDAPILLVPKSSVPAAVSAEIVRLGATRCLIVGGTAVVTDGVKNAIDAIPGMATPRRIAGPNRYETSALVCDAIFTKDGWVEWRGIAAMARGDAFADALALAPISWAARMPILLTNTNYLPAPIDARLPGGPVDLPIFSVAFAGGTSAISSAVYNYVDIDIGLDCNRYAGANRYETAALIADWSAGSPWLSYEAVGLATGANFPDALGGGAAIAKAGGVLLMTEPTRFTAITQTKLNAHKTETAEVQVFGGTSAVNATVFNQVKALY